MGHAISRVRNNHSVHPAPYRHLVCERDTETRVGHRAEGSQANAPRPIAPDAFSQHSARMHSLWTYRHWTGACAVRALCAARPELATSSCECESTLQAWSIESAHGRSDQIRA